MRLRPWIVAVCMLGCSGGGWNRGPRGQPVEPFKDAADLAARELTAGERAKLDQNDLVVLGDGATQSFHVGYTALFHAHKPVYITADSLLYAWHSSYDAILAALERTALEPALASM